MAVTGTITDILTEGYAEVMLLEDPAGRQRYVAENPEGAKRGDTVALESAKPWNDPLARIAYLLPVVFLVLGVLAPRNAALSDRLIIGGVLGILSFVVAWLMNRRARLRRRLAWRVTEILHRGSESTLV